MICCNSAFALLLNLFTFPQCEHFAKAFIANQLFFLTLQPAPSYILSFDALYFSDSVTIFLFVKAFTAN